MALLKFQAPTSQNEANENMSLQGVTHLLHSCEKRLKYLQSRYYTLVQIIGDTFQLEDVNLMLVKQLFVFTKELKEQWKAFLPKIEVLHNLKEQLHGLQVAAVENVERWSRALKEQLQGFEELLSILLSQRKAQSSAVYISGLPRHITGNELSLYFENKRRSGGGMVEEVKIMTVNSARVKFESSEVARNVTRRTHTIEGAQLEVSYRPFTEENSELSSSSRQDDVLAFLEDWLGTVMEDEITGNSAEVEFESEEVPPEILARGSRATEAYNRALLEGKGYARRLPVMIIGQERTGKTSLKRSLKGELFNPNEGRTEGIETDPSYFKVSTDVWRTGKNSADTEPVPTFSFEHQAAQLTVENLNKGETNSPNVSNSEAEPSEIMENIMTELSPQDSKLVEKAKVDSEGPRTKRIDSTLENSQDHLRVPKLPEDIATLVQRLLEMPGNDEDDIYSIIWDFGGQSVYYDTHPIFLTKKAIYILTCDLSYDPNQKACALTKKSLSGKKEDTCCSKTNLDCLNFWMSSVYSLVSPNAIRHETLSPETLPPVFLVCTHADKPYRTDVNPGDLASEIYGSLKDKVYGKLLKGLFVVDNTKSGNGDECQGVIKLRQKVLSFAKMLPQVNEAIPLKWLKYEKVLHLLSKEGYKWLPIEKARQIAKDECGIDDDEQFRTLLNFLHDQRVLINFTETPELENMVILSPQWLIDVFKKVITVKSWEDMEDMEEDVEELWRNLEDHGILDEKLQDHAWRHLFVNQENCKSLIAVMERFSLLCEWPSDESTKQYLVPSMLSSPPTSDVLELLTSAQIPSLFVRFESRRVPPGLFSRLILLFHKWTQERWMSPIKPVLFNNVALFHICPHNATSLVLLCHSSSIEIVLCVGDGEVLGDEASFSCEVDLNVSRGIHRQVRFFLECMRKEFFWLEHMRYEMCVSCPVCSLQKGSSKCRKHCVRGCDCLHLLSELEMQNLPYCKRPVVCGDRRIFKAMFVPWFSFSHEEEGRISLTKQQDVNGCNQGEQHYAVSTREQSLVLPDGVLKSIRSQSCDAEDVVAQMEESVKNLQLKSAALVDPTAETKQWIRCLAINAKNENRMDIVSHLRSIVPAGTTGPLLAENLDVRCIPFKQRKDLTINLGGGDEWKLLAEKLGMSYDEIRFLDKRTSNPCNVVLDLVAHSRHLNVGEVYDILVECELAGSADLL